MDFQSHECYQACFTSEENEMITIFAKRVIL